MPRSVLWFRRDLRLADHPALLAAVDAGDEVLPVFVLDDRLRGPSGAPRLAFLSGCLEDLSASTDGALTILDGDPAIVIPELATEIGATTVHVSADAGPYGRRRDEQVERALSGQGAELVRTGSPYAVTPGRLTKADGSPYQVFSAYRRAWEAHGWRAPASVPDHLPWLRDSDRGVRVPPAPDVAAALPRAGEEAARAAADRFLDGTVDAYADERNRPDLAATSRLSPYLKYGCLHPRTLLARLNDGPGATTFRSELCWRDFYADVLWHRPDTARWAYRQELAGLETDEGAEADRRFTAWSTGRTGYPIVDAGMRQLRGEGWMHNRVRMIVASFLLKDLHLPWQRGAREFLRWLVDGDLASNNHGWQWVAGTGTDAAPYYRVFNPVLQGHKFDPHGDYVRRWVPELGAVAGAAVHEPWRLPGGPPAGYPAPVVDHAVERVEALDRYARART